jgi:hypothetical protein
VIGSDYLVSNVCVEMAGDPLVPPFPYDTYRPVTVTLRVIGGDEKGSLETEAVNYGHESYETRTRK